METKLRKLQGKVCRCSRGHLGVVTGRKKLPWGWSYTGTNVEPERRGLPWASRDPVVVYDNVEDYLSGEA